MRVSAVQVVPAEGAETAVQHCGGLAAVLQAVGVDVGLQLPEGSGGHSAVAEGRAEQPGAAGWHAEQGVFWCFYCFLVFLVFLVFFWCFLVFFC
jgi:hypothetical protein